LLNKFWMMISFVSVFLARSTITDIDIDIDSYVTIIIIIITIKCAPVCTRVYSDRDECVEMSTSPGGPRPCDPGTVCVNTPGSYRCSSSEPSISCTKVDSATGRCVDAGRGSCQPGMRFDRAAGQCVGETMAVNSRDDNGSHFLTRDPRDP